MSEREGSESRSESSLSPGEARSNDGSPKRSPSPVRSNKEPSRSRSRTPPQKSPAREGSRSNNRHRSGSRSRSGSRNRHSHYRSRSRSPRRDYPRRSRSRDRYERRESRDYGRERDRRYYSRSRSRSPGYGGGRYKRSRYSRSRSHSPHYRGYSPYSRRDHRDYRRYRSRSRSPMSSRRRHTGNRDNPKANRCLGVFGLSLYTQERDLRESFSRFGPIEDLQIVYDHQTGRSRGFAFIYMRNEEDALEAKERAPGMEIDGRKIRVDFSITERAHTPTPGIYLGKPTSRRNSARSPYRRRYSRSRSRSRSYSPPPRYSILEE